MTTFMPAPRRALAMPSPMPLAPPVTNAVLPGRFCMVRFPLSLRRRCAAQSAGQTAASHIVFNTYSPALVQRSADEGGANGRGGTRGDRSGGAAHGAGAGEIGRAHV